VRQKWIKNIQLWKDETSQFLSLDTFTFLANVNSRSRSLYAIARPSVCRLSVTLVRPTQAVEIFGNISTALGTLAILWHPVKIFTEIVPGKPLRRGS